MCSYRPAIETKTELCKGGGWWKPHEEVSGDEGNVLNFDADAEICEYTCVSIHQKSVSVWINKKTHFKSLLLSANVLSRLRITSLGNCQ